MKDWKEHAKKNNIQLDTDACVLCGNENGSLVDCVHHFELIIHHLDHAEGIKHMTIFMCVDAHTLSHAEIHGRWNNHFHLTRLHLILEKNIKWTYKHSSLLSLVVDAYKKNKMDEVILSPAKKERGHITLSDFPDDIDDETYIKLVRQWAKEVYNSFEHGHHIASEIAEKFIQQHPYVSQ